MARNIYFVVSLMISLLIQTLILCGMLRKKLVILSNIQTLAALRFLKMNHYLKCLAVKRATVELSRLRMVLLLQLGYSRKSAQALFLFRDIVKYLMQICRHRMLKYLCSKIIIRICRIKVLNSLETCLGFFMLKIFIFFTYSKIKIIKKSER